MLRAGGTVIRARWTGMESAEAFHGISNKGRYAFLRFFGSYKR